MRDTDPAVAAQVRSRASVVPRSFVWMKAKNRTSGVVEALGFWNGEDTVTLSVVSGETGLPETRTYYGWGKLVNIPAIPLVSDLTVRTVTLTMSHLDPTVQLAVRGYDPRFQPIEIHRGYFDPVTRLLIAPPRSRFLGFVNGAPIENAAKGGEGSLKINCVSHSRSLTKTNPGKRGDGSQRLRNGDRFRRYSDVAGQWEFFWGQKKGKVNG